MIHISTSTFDQMLASGTLLVGSIVTFLGVKQTLRQSDRAVDRAAIAEMDKTAVEEDKTAIEGLRELAEQNRQDREEWRTERIQMRSELNAVQQELTAFKRQMESERTEWHAQIAELKNERAQDKWIIAGLRRYVRQLREFITGHALIPPEPEPGIPMDADSIGDPELA